MPIVLLVVAALLISVGFKGTGADLADQLAKDFTGQGNFLYWLAAIVIFGLVGYIPGFQRPVRALMALIIVVLFLANKGIFANFITALGQAVPAQSVTLNQQPDVSSAASAASGVTPSVSLGNVSVTPGQSSAAQDVFGGIGAASSLATAASALF